MILHAIVMMMVSQVGQETASEGTTQLLKIARGRQQIVSGIFTVHARMPLKSLSRKGRFA